MSGITESLKKEFSRCVSQKWSDRTSCKVSLDDPPGNYAVVDIDCVTDKFGKKITRITGQRGDLVIIAEGGDLDRPLVIPIEIKKTQTPDIDKAVEQLQGLVKFCAARLGGRECHFLPMLASLTLRGQFGKALHNRRVEFKGEKYLIDTIKCDSNLWKADSIKQAIL